jgi:hypothetical protein
VFKRPWIQSENKAASVDKSSAVAIIVFFHRYTSKQLVEDFEVDLRFSTSRQIRAQEKLWTTTLIFADSLTYRVTVFGNSGQ